MKRPLSLRTLPAIAFVLAAVAAAPAPSAAVESPAAPPAPAARPLEPLPATEVVAKARAAAGKRGVFLGFHASWCTWCRALEKLTLLPSTKPVFDRHYVVAWLTVDEREARKHLENPGADALRTRLGGEGVALPFYAVLDPSGKAVGTSVQAGRDGKKENIGFPGTPDEVRAFLAFFRAGAPSLTEAEEKALVDGIASLIRR